MLKKRNLTILLVVLLAFGLRTWAAWQLPVDYDEPVYLEGAYDYAALIRAGDWQGVIDYDKTMEHPPLTRLLYALPLLLSDEALSWEDALFTSRMISAVFGTLGVALVALCDPLAGLLLAVQTLAVKYTGQAYLEAPAMFSALLALFAILRSGKLGDGWFWLSAAALGLTAAAKYSYFPILFVILYVAWGVRRYRSPLLAAYLGVAVICFLLFDPHLWNQTIGRLQESLFFHQQYAVGEHVKEVGYPWFQPLIWVSRSHGYLWHPEVFFYMGFDGPICLAALYGAYVEWGKRRWVAVWLAVGMLFLLLWPTKWPQYTLVMLPAVCLAASAALAKAYHYVKEQDTYWGWFGSMFPRPSRRYILAGGSLIAVFAIFVALNTAILTIRRLPWSTMDEANSGLPSNMVNDLLGLPDGRMLVATEGGAAIWQAAQGDELQDTWQVLTPANSGLPSQRVLTLEAAADGALWFGTAAGLARYDGQNWDVFQAADLGLPSAQVNDLAFERTATPPRLWAATKAGVAAYDGERWTSYTVENSGLIEDAVFAIGVQPITQGELLWFGSLSGVVSYNPLTGAWQAVRDERVSMGWGGVSDVMVDSGNRLWVATMGGGISLLDVEGWSYLRTSNSELPYSMVQEVGEFEPGEYWIACSLPNNTGGVVSRLEGGEWQEYKSILSGYHGAETMAMARDAAGRMWFGTRTEGIYIFEEEK